MKPVLTNSISVLGYIGLLLLFNLPYIGVPALIICAVFVKDNSVRSFARAIILIELFIVVAAVVLAMIGFASFGEWFGDFNFDFSGDEGSAFLNSVRFYLGV